MRGSRCGGCVHDERIYGDGVVQRKYFDKPTKYFDEKGNMCVTNGSNWYRMKLYTQIPACIAKLNRLLPPKRPKL